MKPYHHIIIIIIVAIIIIGFASSVSITPKPVKPITLTWNPSSIPSDPIQIVLATRDMSTTTVEAYNLQSITITRNTGSYTFVSTTTGLYAEVGCYGTEGTNCRALPLFGPFNTH